MVRAAGRTCREVKILYSPGKGVVGNCESEECWKQGTGL